MTMKWPDGALTIEHRGQFVVTKLRNNWRAPSSVKTPHGGTYPALFPRMAAAHQHIAPIRDNRRLGPTEDLDREPDGVPHDVVGLAALFSVLFAAVVLGMWLSGSTGRIAAVGMCLIGVPMLVTNLRTRSEREREQYRPSR